MREQQVNDAIRTVRDEAARAGTRACFMLHREHSNLVRIGNSSVSLCTSELLTRFGVDVVDGRRQASHSVLGPVQGPEPVREALRIAVAKARVAPESSYEPIPGEVEDAVCEEDQYDESLASLDQGDKVAAYAELIRQVGDDLDYSGAWSSGVTELFVASTGTCREAWHRGTDQQFSMVARHPGMRWEIRDSQTGWRRDEFRPADAAARLRALREVYVQPPLRVDPGDHPVLLGPEALASVTMMAVWSGFSGRAWEEHQAWTSGRTPGDRVLAPHVTIMDDPTREGTFRFGFDCSGRRRRLFPLVECGILRGLCYGNAAAAKYGRTPTGHDTGSPSIVLSSGDRDPFAAAALSSRPVIVIPALHYTHMPQASKGVFTGSSRFNAVLLEQGAPARPVFSCRITDTVQRVLDGMVAIAPELCSVNQSHSYGPRTPVASLVPGGALCQAIRITDSAETY